MIAAEAAPPKRRRASLLAADSSLDARHVLASPRIDPNHFFVADDPVTQLRYGLPSAVLLTQALILKMSLVPRMETNIIIRELKRIELQLARKSG